jgi:hypothetical protein
MYKCDFEEVSHSNRFYVGAEGNSEPPNIERHCGTQYFLVGWQQIDVSQSSSDPQSGYWITYNVGQFRIRRKMHLKPLLWCCFHTEWPQPIRIVTMTGHSLGYIHPIVEFPSYSIKTGHEYHPTYFPYSPSAEKINLHWIMRAKFVWDCSITIYMLTTCLPWHK